MVTDVPLFHFFYIYLAVSVLWTALFFEAEAGRHAPLLMGEQVQGLGTERGKEHRRRQERERTASVHAGPSWGALSSCGQSPPHLYSKESFHLSAADLKEPPRPKEHRDAAQGHSGHSARGERLSSLVLMGRALLLHRGTISKQHNFAILISD